MASNYIRWAGAAALLLFTISQVTVVAGLQSDTSTPTTYTDSTASSSLLHGKEKRSVSILARNGDLPYYRKEWNKKLHPGFRGMNLENKDDTLVATKRYVGALARGGGFPVVNGKRTSSQYNSISDVWPEDALLEEYLVEELGQKLLQREQAAERENLDVATEGGIEEDPEALEEFSEKRGGVGSLARGGYIPSEGRYATGKRSLEALARSGEILSIGRGSNSDREGTKGGNKRGIGSILRNGGISTIGKIPVYNVGPPSNGKRGIESLARNYAMPSMISPEYAKKYDMIDNEDDDISSSQSADPYYVESAMVDDNGDAPGMITQGELFKRHLGSFARNYGLRLSSKRNIGSIIRNNGYYHGKRNEEYDEDYSADEKRHIASLLRNQGNYIPGKRESEEKYASGADKRHLGSILNDKNAFITGKRYLGSIYRQGLLGDRQEKKENLEEIQDDGQFVRGDYTVGKRSIAADQFGTMKSDISLDQQDGVNESNGTAEDELKKADSPTASGSSEKLAFEKQRDSLEGQEKRRNEHYNHRQRRSLAVPYGTSDEYPMPVLQNTDFLDWETTDEDETTGSPEKRFMGSLARWGWFPRQFRRGASRDDGDGAAVMRWPIPATYQLHKRHIGALARLGWLPAIRSQRRYSRGLGKRSAEEDGGRREDTEYGTQSTENRFPFPIAYTPEAPISLIGDSELEWPRAEIIRVEGKAGVESDEDPRIGEEDEDDVPDVLTEKRYLLLPAIDHLLLRKLYPRQMLPLLV